ncbi:glutamate ABC transporter substrate-binding protein [Rathayibacter tanaceti]|uniref:ABC transporter glutamine-binding protein GlnH n=2 Tax=Rathayibacter tanaceti TaxID=1671680 RepID=A0A166ILU5_9MICO|nr:glutamate ABC transporter substrate-binding protein [Rathayibacter tanaceti]KZX22594.1 ABC transporter glutamine-binding protein GlnH precursor [Rathayibacter tanaceti]QHC55184.1 transporter substrate-binding domain-containing protein [Rathayibacter tanaceti]TCO34806.1 glutamate transport system substrate-binding protein [Rathayibacter tanaceti]
MRTKLMFMTAGLAAATLALAGCAGDSGSAGSGSEGGSSYEVASDVTVEGSPTFESMKADDSITIGVKEDQPGLGYLDAATGERSGFDIEIAKWVAASLGFSEDKINYTSIPSANREASIVNGDIDYYVGTYSITDKRKEQVGFAGPYFETGQQLLVAADNDSITGPDDLSADTTVCSATGSTPIQNIRTNYPEVKTEEFDTYSQCVDALSDGTVDAVTTDGAILIGYAAQKPDELKVVGEPFSTELYGIGLAKDDDALRHFINTMLTEGGDTWSTIYDETLGQSGTTVTQPSVDDY